MTSPAAEANIVAKQRLQRIIAVAVAQAWRSLGHYNQAQVDQFLAMVLPLTAAANRQAVIQTQAFIAHAAQTGPPAVDAQQVIENIRNGTPPAQVYKRPFVTVWTELGRGVPWQQAVRMGQERAVAAAVTDVQLSFTNTLRAVGSYGDRIVGWQRLPDATACDFCNAAAGLIYKTGDLLPLHTYCGCGCEPIFAGDSRAPIASPPSSFDAGGGTTVAVREHGELGPVLTNAADNFTSRADLAHSH